MNIKALLLLLFLCTIPAIGAQEESLPRGNARGDFVPVPDPTRLTTEQLQREISAIEKIFETRFAAMDTAIKLLQARADREPSGLLLSSQMAGLRDFISERFSSVDIQFVGIEKQFKERDTRTDQMAQSTKTAIDAALSAAKESVLQQNTSFAEATRKAEMATKERLDQLTTLFQTETRGLASRLDTINKALDDKIGEMTKRLLMIEGAGAGQLTQRASQDSSNTLILGVVGAIVGMAGLGIAIALAVRRPHAP